MTKRILILIGIVLTLTAVWAGAQDTEAEAPKDDLDGVDSNNELIEVTGPVLYESAAGDFSVRFPPGCATYRERTMDQESLPEDYDLVSMTVYTYCDRKGRSNEGCSVAAYVDRDLEDGPPADSGFVLQRTQAVLKQYGVQVLHQKPYHRELKDGPTLEGVDVLATDPDKTGQVWVRGLLVEGDVYMLTAWRAHGALATDPDFVHFFESFRPHM